MRTVAEEARPGDRRREILAEFRRGWPVVFAGALGTSVGVLGVTYAFTVLMGPLAAEFGWRRSQIPIALTFYTGGVFLMTPWYGRLYDRLGVRRVGAVSVLLFAAAQLAAIRIGGPIWTLYLAYGAFGLLGAGTGYLAYSRAVAARFDKGRGLAMALTMVGPSMAAVLAPLFLPHVVAAYGWRGAYLALGLITLIALPLMLFMVGAPPRGRGGTGAESAVEAGGLTMREAVRTRRFWHLAGGVSLSAMGIVGLQLHFVSMTTDLGASAAQAAQALSLLGLGVLSGRVLTGLLIDRFFAPLIAGAFIIAPALGVALFQVQGVAAAPVLAFAMGLALGAESDLLGFLASRYFGLKSYSEVFGWLYSCFAFGSACSPLVMGAVYELTGGYGPVRAVTAGLCLVGASLYVTAGPYRRFDAQGGLGGASA